MNNSAATYKTQYYKLENMKNEMASEFEVLSASHYRSRFHDKISYTHAYNSVENVLLDVRCKIF